MPKYLLTTLFAVLLSLASSSCILAQDSEEAAKDAMRRGEYEEARRLYRPLLERPPEGGTAPILPYLETFLARGAYDEGLQAAETYLQKHPEDPYGLHGLGRLLYAVGRHEEAERAFRRAAQHEPDFWRNLLELGALLEATGRTREAQRQYAPIYRAFEEGRLRTAPALAAAGRAAGRLEQFHQANEAFRTAYRIDSELVENLYWWAELFREKYNDADAQRTYEEGLAVNPHYADLYVGLAQTVGSFGRKEQLARRALEANPNAVEALSIQAELRILDGLYSEAEALLRQALTVNPASVTALAHLAALHHLRGEREAFAGVEARALDVNPRAGRFYVTAAEDLSRRFRYADALAFARRAVEVDPRSVAAHAALGTNLLRLGRTDEARRHLAASFDRDPFNLYVGNALTLLDEYADFDVLESPRFELLIHRSESAVLGPAILELAETAYDSLRARYPYTPEDKIRIEAYHDAGDFGVRIAGVPHLGLLGVSFGDVVALNTPAAQVGRPHNWARTLWHELAHTMAIGVSSHHVPRWLTEGLSVYEEQRARAPWGREMDLAFFAALDQDRLLPLSEIDRGFTRPTFPGQILLSYYHASQVIEFLVEQYGFDAVVRILQALGRGTDLEASFEQSLGQSLAAVDRAFRTHLQGERRRLAPVLEGMPSLDGAAGEEEEEEQALTQRLAGGSESPFFQILQEGNAALEREDYEAAETKFRQALDLYPGYLGEGSPYRGLAAVYRARGQTDRQMEALAQYLERAEFDAEAARTLGRLYAERGDPQQAAAYFRRSLEVEPYDLPTRAQLAELHAQLGDYEEAVRERRAVLALEPVDRADALYELAVALYQTGETNQAKRAVLQSLEQAPGYREAQRLLLQIVGETQ